MLENTSVLGQQEAEGRVHSSLLEVRQKQGLPHVSKPQLSARRRFLTLRTMQCPDFRGFMDLGDGRNQGP